MEAYIYVLKCPISNQVRYVGKCRNLKARMRQHMYEANHERYYRSHRSCWIRSLLKKGLLPILEVDVALASMSGWKTAEQERIAYYRGLGCDLTNATNGGDGGGYVSERLRVMLAARASATFGTPEGRKRQSEHMKKLCQDKEWREARDRAAKATRATAAYKARMSARSKAKWDEPGYREKMSIIRAKVCADPAFRQKLSESAKRAQAAPEVRAEKAERTRAAWADPVMRQKRIDGIRRRAAQGPR